MVPVNDPIQHSFAAQSSYLCNYMAEHFRWPSPDGGFALFIINELGQTFPVQPVGRKLKPVRIRPVTQAPELAAAGFFAAINGVNAVTPQGWAEAFARLAERDPFPLDRLAFTFRPFELLGVVLGAQHTPTLSQEQKDWLIGVVREAKNKCVTDQWSRFLLALTCASLGLADYPSDVGSLEQHSLDELALLVFLKTAATYQEITFLNNTESKEVHREFLRRVIQEGATPSDIGRAALIYAAIQVSANSLLQSTVDANWQVRSATKDAVQLVVEICRRFPKTVQQLRTRYDSRPPLEVNDEYDVQDLLHALLWLHFDDVRPEEWSPSYGGVSSRMDFLLKSERVVVETKMTRVNLGQKLIVKQLIEDKAHYQTHPDCDPLVAFVYDPSSRCQNPVAIENDLSESKEGFSVRVVVAPRGI